MLPASPSKKSVQKVLVVVAVLVLLVIVVVITISFQQAREKLRILSTPEGQAQQAQKEMREVTQQLSALTIIPDEEPVVATIINADQLKQQSPFYVNASTGDKLVLFQKAQRAYIYNPTRNIIVNTGPLVITTDPQK